MKRVHQRGPIESNVVTCSFGTQWHLQLRNCSFYKSNDTCSTGKIMAAVPARVPARVVSTCCKLVPESVLVNY